MLHPYLDIQNSQPQQTLTSFGTADSALGSFFTAKKRYFFRSLVLHLFVHLISFSEIVRTFKSLKDRFVYFVGAVHY